MNYCDKGSIKQKASAEKLTQHENGLNRKLQLI